MTSSEIILILLGIGIASIAIQSVRRRYWHEFIVQDGFVGLLYHQGKLVDSLASGCYTRWGRHYKVTGIDMRKTLLQIAGQEVLTSDNVGVKVSMVIVMQVADASRAVRAADNHVAHLYSAAQTAIRDVVARVSMDELLGKRLELGARLCELLVRKAEAVGIQIYAAEVRDVMLPGELRKAFGEVLKAKQEGLAALERARGESAALRNMANAARLIENQPALATLRFLQTLSAGGSSQTLLVNDIAAILPRIGMHRGAPAASSESG